ncbi:tetratricopeptide repeat protein [Synechocystis salina]|uniref:tetratricopeptide repeat protein n=1 Tax=Synechocystis salina TaxID=945780 RepID=UPI001D1424AC|nr:tetratricopeptide repeat protein [Synechocystis salina]
MTYNRLEQDQQALADYNQTIQLDPNAAEAYFNRGLTQYRLGDEPKAITDLTKAASLFNAQGKGDMAQKAEAILTQIRAIEA